MERWKDIKMERYKRLFKYQNNINHKPFFIIHLYISQGHISYKNSALQKELIMAAKTCFAFTDE